MTPTVHQCTGDSEDHDTDDTFCRSRPLFLLVMDGQADERAGTPHLQMNRQDSRRRIIRHVRTRRKSRAVCIRRKPAELRVRRCAFERWKKCRLSDA